MLGRVFEHTYRVTKELLRRGLSSRLRRFVIERHTYAEQVCSANSRRVLVPSERVTIASPAEDAFLSRATHYREGWFDRQDIYAAEIQKSFVFVGKGIISDTPVPLITDRGMESRHPSLAKHLRFRKFRLRTLRGDYATIFHPYADNFAHWIFDCLPRAITLGIAYPSRAIVFLMPDTANEFQRETLNSVLQPNFSVLYLNADLWVRTEKLLWASLASGLVNFMLPPTYFHQIRSCIFGRYGLPATHQMTRCIHISRRSAKHRRIVNENALCELLSKYGFEDVEIENLSFREQVELFHQCKILVGAHGSGISTAIFSGPINMIVLYATKTPPNYFHTQSIGLGQKHYYVCGESNSEDADFIVDTEEVRRILDEKLCCAV